MFVIWGRIVVNGSWSTGKSPFVDPESWIGNNLLEEQIQWEREKDYSRANRSEGANCYVSVRAPLKEIGNNSHALGTCD